MNKEIFLLVTLSLSFPLIAKGDSQAGGLPDVAKRVTVLENSMGALQTTVTNLQATVTNLQNAVTNLQSANTNLQTALAKETANRISSDTLLQNSLNQETLDRTNGDLKLQDAIVATGGGKHYSTSISVADVPNGNETSVATLDGLPAGRYFVFAKGLVRNPVDDARWDCKLVQNDYLPAPLDEAFLNTESDGINANVYLLNFVLATTVEMVNPGKIQVFCASGQPHSQVWNINITALQVAG